MTVTGLDRPEHDLPPGRRPGDRPGEPVAVPWTVVTGYRCFGCSPHNEHGLQLEFRSHPDGLQARFQFGRTHESYPGVVHGGMTGVICDEIMGNLIVLRTHLTAFTTSMKVRYISPLLVGTTYDCIARLRRPTATPTTRPGTANGPTSTNGPVTEIQAAAEIVGPDGATMATATAGYRLTALDDARRHLVLADADADRLAATMPAGTDLPVGTDLFAG
ncbi:MAG: PaaI family thioesterase [Frankia sp.]